MIVGATLCIAVGLSLVGGLTPRLVRQIDLNRYKPVWYLTWELQSSDRPTIWAASSELSRRLAAGELSDAQLVHLATLGPLSIMGKPAFPMVLVDCAIAARSNERLDDRQWDEFCRRFLSLGLTVKTPVRHGDPIAFCVNTDQDRGASRHTAYVSLEGVELRVDGQLRANPTLRTDWRNIPNWAIQGGGDRETFVSLGDDVWKEIKPGLHTLALVIVASVEFEPPRERKTPRELTWYGEWALPSPLQIVPPEIQTVQTIVDAQLRERVRECLQPLRAGNGLEIGTIKTKAPIDLAFDVILQQDGREICVGSFTEMKEHTLYWSTMKIPRGFEVMKSDVILRPSTRQAATEMSIETIWGEPVVFPAARD